MSRVFRLIRDVPRRAWANMAADEFLMESQSDASSLPTLRFYEWSQPSISIGYFQNTPEIAQRFGFAKKNIPVVRRVTGGGLVSHGTDLTFSLALKNPNPFFSGDVKDSYLKVNEAVRVGLKKMYPELDYADCKNIPSGRGQGDRVCFENPVCHDLLIGGKKILGASQRRLDCTVLHQSALFLSGSRQPLIENILEGFRQVWGIAFEESAWKADEIKRIEEKGASRYSAEEWAVPALSLTQASF